MSALDIDWLRPVTPDSPTPLQILIDWFAYNGVVYHASSHQREVLGPLCRELNARGLPCEVDQILDYVSYLQEAVHEAATMNRDLVKPLQPYRVHLQQLLFKNGHADFAIGQQKVHNRVSSRLSWLEPTAYCGPSGMEVLVDWLKSNYSVYAHATKKGEKGKMLKELMKRMKNVGIQDCAVNTIRAKIDALHKEVKGEKMRSAAWEQYGSVLEEIFTMGDAGQEGEVARDGDASFEILKDEKFDYDKGQDETIETTKRWKRVRANEQRATDTCNDIHGIGNSIIDDDKASVIMKDSVKHTRSSPTSRLSWMKSVTSGCPSAMELLVEWMERHYAAYTQSTKKGDKGKMLVKLLHKIEAAGHRGCTIHAIRVKIDSLQRQAGGRARPSLAFDQYGMSLRKVFAEKDIIDGIEPRMLSSAACRDGDEAHNSDEDDLVVDEFPRDLVLSEGNVSPDYQDALTDKITTEQIVMSDIESHAAEPTNTLEASTRSPNHPLTSPVSDTEEDEASPAKKTLAGPEVRHWLSAPTQSPSTSEIVRIATLLRERHDLHQRGVPQEQIDKFLPLPNV